MQPMQSITLHSDAAIELLTHSDGSITAQVRLPGGKRLSLDQSFSRIESAITSALKLFVGHACQREICQSFEHLHQLALITLQLLYFYVQSSERDALLQDAQTVQQSETNIYGEMYGPLGQYEVLEFLMLLGYVQNVSTRRSRWSKIMLTTSGARVAQKIGKPKPRLPGLP